MPKPHLNIGTCCLYRTMWIRLDVVRMFVEHTCPPGQSTHPADAQNAFQLWKVKSFFNSFSGLQK
jgi:hypothetical protein